MEKITLRIEVRGSEEIEVDAKLYREALKTGCLDELVRQYTDLDVSLAGTIIEPNGSIYEF